MLDSVLVGPVYPGQYRFVFQVRARVSNPCVNPCMLITVPAPVTQLA